MLYVRMNNRVSSYIIIKHTLSNWKNVVTLECKYFKYCFECFRLESSCVMPKIFTQCK